MINISASNANHVARSVIAVRINKLERQICERINQNAILGNFSCWLEVEDESEETIREILKDLSEKDFKCDVYDCGDHQKLSISWR